MRIEESKRVKVEDGVDVADHKRKSRLDGYPSDSTKGKLEEKGLRRRKMVPKISESYSLSSSEDLKSVGIGLISGTKDGHNSVGHSRRRRSSDSETLCDAESSPLHSPNRSSRIDRTRSPANLLNGSAKNQSYAEPALDNLISPVSVETNDTGFNSGEDYDSDQELITKDSGSGMSRCQAEIDISVDYSRAENEGSWHIALQVFFPFLAAGFGTVSAGLLLDHVQHWSVYVQIPEVFILVPALLGLKGNLEMTLASRLSTAANVGSMNCAKERLQIIIGNLILTQAQALVVAALAALCAMVFRWVAVNSFDVHHAFLLGASSLITASLASLLLGSVMIGVILFSKKLGMNPDNIATPIAASLGDLVTLALLSLISQFLFTSIGSTKAWIAPLLCGLCVILLPLWFYISHHNKHTNAVLYNGWMPVILAMAISSGGGVILSLVVVKYNGIAVFSPVINGVGGNLVAVQASRLATHLHMTTAFGSLPATVRYGCIRTFCTGGGHSRTARVLLFMSIPGHLIFLGVVYSLQAGHTSTTPIFVAVYLFAGILQVGTLLFTCNWLVHFLWKRKLDPDNHSIPYLTALGDLLGTALLAVAFHFLYVIGDRDSDVGD